MRVLDRRSYRSRRSDWRRCQIAPRLRSNEPSVACLHMDVCTTLDQSGRAVAVCLDYLRHLGIEWSPHPTEEEVRREYERIWSLLGSRTIEELIDLPLMRRPGIPRDCRCSEQDLAPACVHTDANLACPGDLQSGQSQPRARQLRCFVCRLCHARPGSPARVSATIRPDFASASSATNSSNDAG